MQLAITAASDITVTANHTAGYFTPFSCFSAPCKRLYMLTRFKYIALVAEDSANTPITSPTVSSNPLSEYAANVNGTSVILVITAIRP